MLRRLAIPLLALAAFVAPPAAKASSSAEYFGTNLQTLGAAKTAPGAFFQALADQQLTIGRFQLDWRAVESTSPASNGGQHQYSWGSAEYFIRGLAERGLRAAPLFRFAPDWAGVRKPPTTPGGKSTFDELPPSSYDDFGLMVAAFAKRFGPGGTFWRDNPTLPYRPTLSYELWNEANLDEYAWNGHADPALYSGLLKVARPIIKAAQPTAVLLGSMAWQNDASEGAGVYPAFVAGLAAAGGLGQLDGMGFHPYGPDAQSTMDLVIRLKAQLAAAGRGDLPIYANENGWPAKYGEPGDQFAHQGLASDAGRGASLAFAGEALALSDCSVENFLPYSIIATERASDPHNEGFMGMFFAADAKPNETALAIGRAAKRWSARLADHAPAPGERLTLCSGGPSPAASMLPIQATFTGAGPQGCVTAHATYDGASFESAYLRLRAASGGELASARTDARGNATACVEPFLLGQPFTAVVDVQRAGTSGFASCDVPGVGCPAGVSMAPAIGQTVSAWQASGYQEPASQPPVVTNPRPKPPANCEWALTAAVRSSKPAPRGAKRVTITARVDCPTRPAGTAVRFVLSTKRAKAKRETRIRSVYLKTGKPTKIAIVRRFAKTDQLVLLHKADGGTGIPRIRTALKVSAPKSKR